MSAELAEVMGGIIARLPSFVHTSPAVSPSTLNSFMSHAAQPQSFNPEPTAKVSGASAPTRLPTVPAETEASARPTFAAGSGLNEPRIKNRLQTSAVSSPSLNTDFVRGIQQVSSRLVPNSRR